MGYKGMTGDGTEIHRPVMADEVISFLISDRNGIYLDATTGTGGHSLRILEALAEEGRLISLDRDQKALEIAAERCSDRRQVLLKGSFSSLGEALDSLNIGAFDGALFDLGVSMLQLKDMERGFSFSSSGRLDMRMDRGQAIDAYRVVNDYPEKDLEKIIREYGEECNAKKIARAISQRRVKRPIAGCSELADIISSTVGFRGRIHPATKTFQAIRMEVNSEIAEIRAGLGTVINKLKKGGRLCVISYHSVEDREIKTLFKNASSSSLVGIVTKKPVRPSMDEIRDNRASRSAKLRVCEKL